MSDLILGTVKDIIGGIFVQLDREQAPRAKPFRVPADMDFTVGDRVVVAQIGGSYVILQRLGVE